MYILIVLLSALFLGAYEVLKKLSLKKSDVYEVLFFYCLSAFIVSLIFVKQAFNINFVNIILILLKSGVIVCSWLLTAKVLKKLDVGIVVPFGLINTILVVFGSWIVFKEKVTWIHLISLILISFGIILIALLEKKDNKKNNNKNQYGYLFLLLLANVFSACSALLDKYLIKIHGVNSNTVLIWFMFFNTLIYGIIYYIKNKKIELNTIKNNYWMILTGIAIASADITYYTSISMEGAQLSVISILRKCSVVFATILSSLFLKEKHLFKKLGILLLMLLGAALPIANISYK